MGMIVLLFIMLAGFLVILPLWVAISFIWRFGLAIIPHSVLRLVFGLIVMIAYAISQYHR